MSYAQLHDTVPMSRKLSKLTGDAYRVWTFGLIYAQVHKTDGFIPLEVVPVLGLPVPRTEQVAELVQKQCWKPAADGYQIHDYLQWNASGLERDQRKQSNRDRQQRFRDRLKQAKTGAPQGQSVAPVDSPPPAVTPVAPPPNVEPAPPPKVEPPRRAPRGPSLIVSPLEFEKLKVNFGYIGPRFRVPRALHMDLVGRYGGDERTAEDALAAWYESLENSLGPDEAIPNIFKFINAHFEAWMESLGRGAKMPATTPPKAGDQRVSAGGNFRDQLNAANARRQS